jgi:hypothetical protein
MIWSGMRGMLGDVGSDWEFGDGDGERDDGFMLI